MRPSRVSNYEYGDPTHQAFTKLSSTFNPAPHPISTICPKSYLISVGFDSLVSNAMMHQSGLLQGLGPQGIFPFLIEAITPQASVPSPMDSEGEL